MNNVISSEVMKLRTLLTPRLVLGLGALVAGFGGYVVAKIAADNGTTMTMADAVTVSALPMWFLVTIVAVVATAGEFHHRTIHTTLLHVPRRGQVLAGKALVVAAYGAVIAGIGAVTSMVGSAVTLHAESLAVTWSPEVFTAVAKSALLAAMWAVLAAGLGALVRNTTVAIVTVLVWKFVIEGVLLVIVNEPEMRRWLPSGAADAVMSHAGPALLQPWAGGLLFFGYTLLVVAAGAVMFVRRDPA
jgi:ABC-2 type transport system permease protein